ncbi:MAG: hypothetical protein Q4D82_08270 [Neisseria sp.]|nr:hypothetical protein [Neisseria sp.]
MNRKIFLPLTAALILTACAGGPSVSGNWQHIGNTHNGNIRAYIDKDSISRQGDNVSFRDRKVVQKPEQERYVNMPAYKTAVGTWQIQCRAKTYRLTALQLLAADGREIFNQQYAASMVAASNIPAGSLTEAQWKTVCAR